MERGQRLTMVFSRGEALRFLSHLDMMRLWERALRRARLPLSYSQGYHPHPRLSLASPLSVGMTAEAEWLAIEMRFPLSLDEVKARLAAQLPAGMALRQVEEAPHGAPALMARLQGAEYEVQFRSPPPREQVQEKVGQFLQADHCIVQEQYKGRLRTVDLREVVVEVEVGPWETGRGCLRLVLRLLEGRGARLGTILGVFGIGPQALFHRKRLFFGESQVAEKGA